MTADPPRPVSGRAPHAAGFTLLEVVIAIGILGTILVLLFGTYTAVAERAAHTRDLSQIYHEARVLLRLMADDVRSASVKPAPTPAPQTAQASATRWSERHWAAPNLCRGASHGREPAGQHARLRHDPAGATP
jgi:prepilin-type N-terminal cleavage/methylation domain-containing protein